MAYVGLVPRIQYWEEEVEPDNKPGAIPIDKTIYKYITFNEKVIMFTVLFGILFHCLKKKYFDNWNLGINNYRGFEKWKSRKAGMERIILRKHPYDPWGQLGGDSDDEGVINFKHGSEKSQYNLINVIPTTSEALNMDDPEEMQYICHIPPNTSRKLGMSTAV